MELIKGPSHVLLRVLLVVVSLGEKNSNAIVLAELWLGLRLRFLEAELILSLFLLLRVLVEVSPEVGVVTDELSGGTSAAIRVLSVPEVVLIGGLADTSHGELPTQLPEQSLNHVNILR